VCVRACVTKPGSDLRQYAVEIFILICTNSRP
jgi:hypothetical protein